MNENKLVIMGSESDLLSVFPYLMENGYTFTYLGVLPGIVLEIGYIDVDQLKEDLKVWDLDYEIVK